MTEYWPVFAAVGAGLVLLALSGIRIAQEYERAIVFRLGRFHSIRGPGLYYNLPLLEWQRKVDMRTVTVNVEPQETISKDSVTIKVNAVLWYRIADPTKSVIWKWPISSRGVPGGVDQPAQHHRPARSRRGAQERDQINDIAPRTIVDKVTGRMGGGGRDASK